MVAIPVSKIKVAAFLACLTVGAVANAQTVTLPQPAARALAYEIYMGNPQSITATKTQQYWLEEAALGTLSMFSPWPIISYFLTITYGTYSHLYDSKWYSILQGSSNPNIDSVTIRYVGYWPTATYKFYPEGQLLRELHSPDVYVICGRAPLYVSYGAYFNNDWSKVRVVPDGRISAMSKKPISGTMFREQSKPEVWYSNGWWKSHVMSGDAVNRLGGWSKVHIVPNSSIGHIPNGPDIY